MLNPLLAKELRVQMRGREIYAVGTIYLMALSALTFSLLWEASTGDRTFDPDFGREMFLSFAVVLTLATCLICPAFTVGSVSLERERLTFEQLRVTALKPYQMLVGKALPPLIYAFILLFASLPMAILIASSGGVSTSQMISCYLISLVATMAFTLYGLMCSTMYKTTRSATTMTYALMGFFTLGTAMLPIVFTGVFHISFNRSLLNFLIALNPFQALMFILGRGRDFHLAGLSPWAIAMIGYVAISILSALVTISGFKQMRS